MSNSYVVFFTSTIGLAQGETLSLITPLALRFSIVLFSSSAKAIGTRLGGWLTGIAPSVLIACDVKWVNPKSHSSNEKSYLGTYLEVGLPSASVRHLDPEWFSGIDLRDD